MPDFLCVLGKEERRSVFPETAFYVQVKSNAVPVTFDRDAAKWISLHMDLPLILCVVEKRDSLVKLYSCWNVWTGLFKRTRPEELILEPDTSLPLAQADIQESNGEVLIKVPVGPPVIEAQIDNIETDSEQYYGILKKWLESDKQNIARRAIGRIFASGYINWETNRLPKDPVINWYFFGPNYNYAESEIAPILTALAHNYRHNKEEVKLNAVISMLRQLRPLLDPHGKKFADGKLRVEQ